MLSYRAHYLNKYPGGRVHSSDSSMQVYCAAGRLRVALAKNGAGQWVDVSEEQGAEDKHDLSPIPKQARAIKLYGRDGEKPRIGKSEEHAERAPLAQELAAEYDGRIPSVEELLEKKRPSQSDLDGFEIKAHLEAKKAKK